MLAFFDIRPGMRVAELGAAGGYTTELLARVVGPKGRVYGQNPKFVLERFAEKPWSERLAKPVNAPVVRVDREFDDPLPPEAKNLDAVLIVLIYHDTVWLEVDRARMNAAVFAALKSGGIYGVIDHSARPGAGTSETKTLHRIEESVVVARDREGGLRARRRGRLHAQPRRRARLERLAQRGGRAARHQRSLRAEVQEALSPGRAMLTLFSNGFSPFARKVAMALAYKGLEYETVDGLTHANHERLLAVNPRAEVPVLVDGDVTVVNSSDIVAYLDLAYPERPIYPADLKARVEARALERLADTRVDAILLDCSIWTWAERKDPPLPGLARKPASAISTAIFARIESHARSLRHAAALRPLRRSPSSPSGRIWRRCAPLGFSLDAEKYPRLAAWFGAMRRDEVFSDDARRTAEFMKAIGTSSGLRAHEALLARRSHRMAARARLPRLVLRRNQGGSHALAGMKAEAGARRAASS